MPDDIKLRIAPIRRRSIVWRGLILVLVLACGYAAFAMGVTVSERPDVASAGALTHLYYAIGLFVLGGLDLGMPSGGPPMAVMLMWFAYFAAPAVTTLSVVEGILRTFGPERWLLRRLRSHIVIAGGGRLGRLYLRALRRRYRRHSIILVELQPEHPATMSIRKNAHLVTGDIRANGVLDLVRIERAERVFLLTGDDFANLDAASKITARVPHLCRRDRVCVHVGDLHFLRGLSPDHSAVPYAVFNAHDIAARRVVESEILTHFRRTSYLDMVVLAGFGRFGQSVLANLQERASGSFARLVIIDLGADKRAAVFDEQVGFADFYRHQICEGDLRDPRIWHSIDGLNVREPVFIIGTGDDGANLRIALWAKRTFPNAYVAARTFEPSPFASAVGQDSEFLVFSLADMVLKDPPGIEAAPPRRGLRRVARMPTQEILPTVPVSTDRTFQ